LAFFSFSIKFQKNRKELSITKIGELFMHKFILSSLLLFSFSAFSQQIPNPKIRPVECRVSKGVRSDVRVFTLHDNYDLLVFFNTVNVFLMADHMGNAGFPGEGYRYVIYIKDQKIGGFVQGAASSTVKGPLAFQDISFEDQKYGLKVRCKGR
jgi:hypothetical protein